MISEAPGGVYEGIGPACAAELVLVDLLEIFKPTTLLSRVTLYIS